MILNELVEIRSFRARSSIQNSRNTTLNNRDIVSRSGAQKWVFGITTQELTEAQFLELMANIAAQDGSYGEFQIKIPLGSQNIDKSMIKVSAIIPAGQTNIPIRPHGYILPGTFVKFNNHAKVYQIRSSTSNEVTIYPPLTTSLGPSNLGQIDEPVATVRNADDMAELELFAFDRAMPYDLTLIEVI